MGNYIFATIIKSEVENNLNINAHLSTLEFKVIIMLHYFRFECKTLLGQVK